jgi:hypothetical protein
MEFSGGIVEGGIRVCICSGRAPALFACRQARTRLGASSVTRDAKPSKPKPALLHQRRRVQGRLSDFSAPDRINQCLTRLGLRLTPVNRAQSAMSVNSGTLEADLVAEVCRVARMRQETLRQRTGQNKEPSPRNEMGSRRRQLCRVEVHGQRSAFLEQVAGWRQLAQHQSSKPEGEFPDWA